MRHKQFKEWLQLSLYDELSKHERELLNSHLTACEQCRNDLDELKKLHAALVHRRSTVASELLLQDSRRSLRLRIHTDAARLSYWTKVRNALDEFLAPPVQAVLGVAATLAIGIAVGYFVFKSPSEKSFALQETAGLSSVMETGESQIMNIRFLDRDEQTGNVEFTFETVTPVRIHGNVNDERVQKVLARALVSNRNAGTRLRAVNMIGAQTDQKQARASGLDTEVKSALITALLHDRNLGVRKEALTVLKNYLPDPAIVRAFLDVLANDKNTGLKIAAINSLDLSKYENKPVNSEILEMFKRSAQSDDNNYIRIRAKAALQEVQQ